MPIDGMGDAMGHSIVDAMVNPRNHPHNLSVWNGMGAWSSYDHDTSHAFHGTPPIICIPSPSQAHYPIKHHPLGLSTHTYLTNNVRSVNPNTAMH
jgi:hypothetical protein